MGDGVTTVAGPFTVEARQEILAYLLAVQTEVIVQIGDSLT